MIDIGRGILAAFLLGAPGTGAAMDENLRRHALEYAGLITRAHDVLADHIENRSAAPVGWAGAAIPGGETGWRERWTEAGLRARYCDGELLVYMGVAAPKGIGAHHRDIQMASRLYLSASDTGLTLPPLHRLDGRRVDSEAFGTVTLPGCMESTYTEALPRGRAALLRAVPDPWLARRPREDHQVRDVACGPGRHGEGVRERRRVRRDRNGRGDWMGTAQYGPWEVLVDTCRDDYVYHRTFGQECTWYQGEPFDREMRGITRWRQAIQVNAAGEQALGDPVLVGTTCWDEGGGPAPIGDPTTLVSTATQEEERSCDAGYTGSVWFERNTTTTTTTVPWDASPFVTVAYGTWQEVRNTCVLPDREDPPDEGAQVEPGERGGGCDCGRPGDPCAGGGFF